MPQDRVFLSCIRATAQLYIRLRYFTQTHPLLICQSWRYVDDGISAIGAVVDGVLLHFAQVRASSITYVDSIARLYLSLDKVMFLIRGDCRFVRCQVMA